MNDGEMKKCLKLLTELFPKQLTPEQSKLLADDLRDYSHLAVMEAVREHRRLHEFINIPQLLEGCRSASRAALVKSNSSDREGSWFDVRRRQGPHLAGRSDAEVALRVHRDFWVRCPQTDQWKEKLIRECSLHLRSCGYSEQDAATWALTIFEPAEYFRVCLFELRDSVASPANEEVPV